MLLIAGLTMGVAGCSDDDPDYDHVTRLWLRLLPIR